MKFIKSHIKKIIIIATIAVVTCLIAIFVSCGINTNTATPDTATKDTAIETTDATANTEATTKSAEEKKKEDAIKDAELTVKDGKVVDKDGKEVTEVKTSDGTTVKVSVSDVSSANSGNSGSSSNGSGSTSNKNNSSSSNNTSSGSNTNKPSSSSNNSGSGSSTSTDEHAGKTYHEAVYGTIKHPAVMGKKWVVDVPEHTEEEPVYERRYRTFCNDCGADITDLGDIGIGRHICDHAENGGKGSYHNAAVDIQVGTKTITIEEVGHYETYEKTPAWTETYEKTPAGWY